MTVTEQSRLTNNTAAGGGRLACGNAAKYITANGSIIGGNNPASGFGVA